MAIERVASMLHFAFRGVEVKLHDVRQAKPLETVAITYEFIVNTDEPDRRLDLLHENVRKFGTIFNSVAGATRLERKIGRKS
ncbi:hypothetical protein [Hyphomicrobium sp.]|uniref:hypothetical protein n=1 Tax=Hyphomicrobium sp. TaxID=82 RepID=UPI0025C0D548|nr:hypothetical protein [Hyphomicrobium sp.]